jgi:hypothetical protein
MSSRGAGPEEEPADAAAGAETERRRELEEKVSLKVEEDLEVFRNCVYVYLIG